LAILKTAWKNVRIENSDLGDLNFESTGMFQKGSWENVTLIDCQWNGLRFQNYELKNVTFEKVSLNDLCLDGVRWEGRTFRSTEEVKAAIGNKA
jgi:uncharacterized protein YjbI with pentapeptide repeats